MNRNVFVLVLLVLAAGCKNLEHGETAPPPMDPSRKVSQQVCTRILKDDGFNLLCRTETDAEYNARIAEEERLARERKEAAERAERERLEAERAAALAAAEAARQAQLAEQERLAAEQRRREAEAAAAAAAERERQEKLAAEARARELAEQEAREAAARECRRLAQEAEDGRALLTNFVDNYGKIDENKGIAGQITTFLGKPRKVKPCPPATDQSAATSR